MNAILSPEISMIDIPAGGIILRDDRLDREWHVEVSTYQLARYPITQQMYAAVAGQWPSARIDLECPVESVSWIDAVRFCNLLSHAHGMQDTYEVTSDAQDAWPVLGSNGYRLPTEAEWEYACRAGSSTARYGLLDEIAWYGENSAGSTRAVGQKRPNEWGLHDMLGNVWEWCSDQYDPEVYGTYRIFRGGGWADSERGCLATNRRRSHPTFAIDDLGFRVARSTTL